MAKQSKIIIACMTLHNFIRRSGMMDDLFDLCDQDENYIPNEEGTSTQTTGDTTHYGGEDENMNQFRDWIVNGLFARS